MGKQIKTIRCIIVDDESDGINTLEYMLQEYCQQVEVLQTFQSSVEALKKINSLQPDLLFLDIKMPEISGLKLLEILGPNTYNSIFVTAHQDEYMLQALRLYDIPYLKKPFEENELIQAIQRIQQTSKRDFSQILRQGFDINSDTQFGIKVGNKKIIKKLSEINYFKSNGNYTYVFLTNDKSILCSDSLGYMEDKLPEKFFFRCHKEYLLNKYSIIEWEAGYVIMKGRKRISISKSKRKDFQNFIGDI